DPLRKCNADRLPQEQALEFLQTSKNSRINCQQERLGCRRVANLAADWLGSFPIRIAHLLLTLLVGFCALASSAQALVLRACDVENPPGAPIHLGPSLTSIRTQWR